ncbi:hypothetical protein OG21DRAFT_1494075 [Imleria badia]|nr:hypothetical protein OG21DRAFT_1494075 [Imleria badia]
MPSENWVWPAKIDDIAHFATYQPDRARIASISVDITPATPRRYESRGVRLVEAREQPHLLSDTTFYRHLAEAEQDERNRVLLFKPLPLDSARRATDSRDLEAEEDPSEQAGPSTGTFQYARRVKTERALLKRARETPDALHRVGKRKCARTVQVPERVKRETPPRYPSPSESLRSQRSPSPDDQPDVFDHPGSANDFFRLSSPVVQDPPNLPQIAQQDHENHPEPPNDPDPQRRHGEAWNIVYDRRRHPFIDLEALSRSAVLLKIQETLEFVNHVRNASFEDPIAKATPTMLARLRNPPEAPIQLNDPGIRHSISTYLALEHVFQAAYERVIKSTKQNFPGAPGAKSCLKFQAIENLIAS